MARDPSTKKIFRFAAVLEKMEGRFGWTYVEFPHDVQKLYGKKGSVRVKGSVNGVPMDRALMPTKRGVHFIVFGVDLRRKARIKVGDKVKIEVWLNPDPKKVELPDELRETLDFFPDLKQGWKRIKPGMQRSICIWINQGKTVPTRSKRVAELLKRFETGHPWFREKTPKR